MRTRILPKMLNDEVEEYLSRNDIIIVPVGTVEDVYKRQVSLL